MPERTEQMPNPSINVLLIEDSNSVAASVIASLATAESFDVEWCTDLTSSLKKLRTATFDIVLLELCLADSAGIDTLVRVRNECPDVPVVVLTADDQVGAMHAISEGAQDWITKDTWNPGSLPRILRFAIARHKNSHPPVLGKKGNIFTFIGAKGGVGTTTVALNVAAALAASQRLTVATEWCWPRGNFSLYLSERQARNYGIIGGLRPRSITGSRLKKLAVTPYHNLMLLHGPQTADDFAYLNPAQANAFVNGLREIADYVVFDLPPHPSAVSRAAVQNSSVVVIVLERNRDSLLLANEGLSMVRSWAVRIPSFLLSSSARADRRRLSESTSCTPNCTATLPVSSLPASSPCPGSLDGFRLHSLVQVLLRQNP